jgi:hypothetical protein
MSPIRASKTETLVATRTSSAAPKGRRSATAKIGPGLALGAAVRGRGTLGASTMLALQKAVGNRAVAGLVQAIRERSSAEPGARVHEAAKLGIGGASGRLPHLERIQRSFGRHDVTGVVAHADAQATAGAQAMGAVAFTMRNHVAFAGNADLHTAAHEAAHVVQQRAGVQLAGGVGQAGDPYERHADAVAGLVVQGRSAEAALDRYAGNTTGSHVQRTAGGGSSGGSPVQAKRRRGGQRQQSSDESSDEEWFDAEPGESSSDEEWFDADEQTDTLAGDLRRRLVKVDDQLIGAAARLPDRVRRPWEGAREPDAVEDRVRPAIERLRTVGGGRFGDWREATEAEQRTAELVRFGDEYADYCDEIRAELKLPFQYLTSYYAADPDHAASLDPELTERIDDACRSIQRMAAPAEVIRTFRQLVPDVQQVTAVTSKDLRNERGTAQGRVQHYFELGRLRIGHNRSFYASSFDAPAGSFGGEWALVTADPYLKDLAKDWVYHTHCRAIGDTSTHVYTGFTITRAVGASHIKQRADAKATGVSVTVDYPPEFDRIEQRDRECFLDWLNTADGYHAIRKRRRK